MAKADARKLNDLLHEILPRVVSALPQVLRDMLIELSGELLLALAFLFAVGWAHDRISRHEISHVWALGIFDT